MTETAASHQDGMTHEADIVAALGGRSIVLVGMMGSGKSTIGRRLGARLHVPFLDADHEIEIAHAGMTVSEIFAQHGEPYFRDGEARVIARLLETGPCVIATGGGAFMNEETRALILSGAIAIWLDADIRTLVERVSRRNTRPLLRNGNPAEVLTRLAEQRNPIYAEAQIHVRSKDGPHHRTVTAILEGLARWHG